MKNFLFVMWLSMILAISTCAYAEKIAIINIDEIFQEIATNKAVPTQLEKEFKSRVDELQKLEKILYSQLHQWQNSGTKPSEKERQLFETKRIDYINKSQQFKEDYQRRQQEEGNKILQTIKRSTKAIAEKESYDVVVDLNAVLYPEKISNLKNITDLVIKRVQ
ncbi:OmpH family outer membrane protein [Arsenophonus sp.]|uniref:OmpH family outer membrane protein n=1 Tax=Arsenophonus sp. TaxID=1872640 RepID=UPI0028594800|nr:OmpH family outer membrane protein [Arsenophonus sp.]MDR5617800.1 OmpH family outer membrane protein [Arsenophonus sp.]